MAPGVPARSHARMAVAQPTTAGARFAWISSSTSSGEDSCSDASRKLAALFTQPANVPASLAASTARSATTGSAASPPTTTARASPTASASRSTTTTACPSTSSRSTTARPTPRPPPVTTYDLTMPLRVPGPRRPAPAHPVRHPN